MIYISTDYVFNGQGEAPWQPDCTEYAPLNVYGQTKLDGELAVKAALEKYFIVRIAWVFGLNGNNFIKTMLNIGKKYDTLRVVCDQVGTPTYTYDLARLLVDMIETDVRVTKDGVLVLMHDEKITRTADFVGSVSEMTYEELVKVNVGDAYSPQCVPTYAEFMEWAAETGIMLNIEIKEYYSESNKERCEYCIEKVIELVDKYGMSERAVINSFDAYVLEYVYKKYGKKYMLHGFYPYNTIMKNVSLNPDDYLYCACIFAPKNKEYYDYLTQKGIEPWIGAGVTQKSLLKMASEYGARLVTCNNTADILAKLKELGLR